MNSNEMLFLVAFIVGLLLLPAVFVLFRGLTIQVEDEESIVVTKFGRLSKVLSQPGLHWCWDKLFPWTTIQALSLKRDFMNCEKINVNDCRGTTVVIDLWIEFRVVNPERALFSVSDWELGLKSIVTSAATSILGTFDFSRILTDRNELGAIIREQIKNETIRWGIEVDLLFISRLSLLSNVSQQLFDTVAARIERAKADIDETGRLNAQLLEAETSAAVASLVAEAKSQYGIAVSRAYASLKLNPEIFTAYKELFELSQVRAQRAVVFEGFGAGEISALDAVMAVHHEPTDGGLARKPAKDDSMDLS